MTPGDAYPSQDHQPGTREMLHVARGHADPDGRRRRPRRPDRLVGAVRRRPPARLRQPGSQGAALHPGGVGARPASTTAATAPSTATELGRLRIAAELVLTERQIRLRSAAHRTRGTAVDVNDLVEIEAIKRVKYRYMRTLDQKLWDEMATCFTDDAVAAYSGGQVPLRGQGRHPRVPLDVDGRRDVPLGAPHPPARDRPDRPDHRRRHVGHGRRRRDDRLEPHHPRRRVLRGRVREGRRRVEDRRPPATSAPTRRCRTGATSPGLRLTASWWATGGVSEIDV